MSEDSPPLLAIEPGYRNVLRLRLLVTWGVITAVVSAVERYLLFDSFAYGAATLATVVVGLLVVAIAPPRIHKRIRYRLTDRVLQVVRGWLFHADTVVPLVRVQHLDVTRGPFDKMFGTATLIVHTAGTHNSIVTVPGLAPERAAEMRDIIREHVRTDFA